MVAELAQVRGNHQLQFLYDVSFFSVLCGAFFRLGLHFFLQENASFQGINLDAFGELEDLGQARDFIVPYLLEAGHANEHSEQAMPHKRFNLSIDVVNLFKDCNYST